MVWFTLRSLCIQKVAEMIVNGKLSTSHSPKDLKKTLLSENILSVIPTSVLQEFFATKNLPIVFLNGEEASTIISNQIVFEDLEYLNISDITDEELLQIGQTLKGYTGAVPPTLCLIAFIQSVMGKSWSTLRQLNFHNTNFDFNPLHTSLLALSIPNLTGLHFGEKNIKQYEFQNICRSFSQITRLSLPNTSMKSLDGISALSNLEYLELLLSHFKNHDSIKEIFSCKKLKVLDISSNPESEDEDDEAVGRSPNFSSYMACNDVLPELECLDISFNNITEQQLEALINSHKKLVVISLIGTSLQTRIQFENRNVVLLTVSDLPNCIKSLQHYNGKRHLFQSLKILHVIGEVLRDNYAEQSVEMLHECFLALIARGAIIDRKEVHVKVLDCFYELCKDGRIAIFSIVDILLLFIYLKKSFKSKWEENEDHGLVNEIQTRIWSIFETVYFSRSFPYCKKDIFGYSVDVIKHADVKVNYPLRTALRIIHDSCMPDPMGHRNNTFFQFLFDNHFQDRLLHLLGSLNFAYEDYDDVFLNSFYVLNSMLWFLHPLCLDRVPIAVIIFSQNLEQFDGKEKMQKIIVEQILNDVTNNTIDEGFIFEGSCFSVLTNMMTSCNAELREVTIELLVTLFIFAKCPYQSKPLVKETMGSLLKERIDEINNAIMTFIPNEENHNMLTLYQWLISREPKRVRAWARWILEHFPGEEKERAMKRRLEEEENADFGFSNFLFSQ